MFTLAFDRRHKILLARVSGVVNSSEVAALDDALLRFNARHGPTHDLMDFTSVSTVAVPISRMVQRGQPPLNGYKRVVVVANGELAAMARSVAREPMIVASMDEALRLLGARTPSFEPIERT